MARTQDPQVMSHTLYHRAMQDNGKVFNPHDKIFDQTELKVFADDNLNVTKMIISAFDRVENIVGKGEILLVQAISPFPTMFSKGFFPRLVKRCHCVEMG